MNHFNFSLFVKIILGICLVIVMIACNTNPHKMQYLVNRNYLTTVGLSRSVNMLDYKGDERVKAIHIGTPDHPRVMNYMQFDSFGNLISVSKEKGEDLILRLVEFKYNSHGRLMWIIPNKDYFSALNYDSLKIEYKGSKPIKSIAFKRGFKLWIENITFDDRNGTYLFSRILDSKQNELYNLYRFGEGKIVSEYHKNRLSDNNIDSTRYYYRNNKRYKKSGIFNGSMVHIVNYDEEERPTKNTTMFYKKDSVAWVDYYYYLLDDKLPHSIITASPLGWGEETNYYWEK